MKIAIVNLITRTSLIRRKAPRVDSNKDAMIVKFAKEMQKRVGKIDLYISRSFRPPQKEELGVNIVYLSTILRFLFWPTLLPFTPSLSAKLRNKYDVVICSEIFQWSTVFAVLAKIFSKKIKLKIIVWQEMSKHQKLFRKIPSLFFYRVVASFFLDRHIDLYVPRSELSKQFLIKENLGKGRISPVIRHGFDKSNFFFDPKIQKENYIFSPSRIVACKGIDVLLKAFAIAKGKGVETNLLIQGEGPKLKEYSDLAKELKIDMNVQFSLDRLNHDEMRKSYQRALVTIVSSRSDLFIFSVVESLACGTPVIVSTGVDSHYFFIDKKGGLFFESENYKQLAELIVKYFFDKKLQVQMQKEALEKAKTLDNEYLAKLFAEEINKLLEK